MPPSHPVRREPALGGLPGALRTYALVWVALGRTEESVAAYDGYAGLLRAMSLRELGARAAGAGARVLSELTSGLRELGRCEEALTIGREGRDAADGVLVWTLP
ncbi:hypothetical protein ACFV7R_27740 [Streptomyces sp. NPDC059866]|uniref:hypothetical protein n=1 Tax=Streptomyces sp. NPDC059866 TaxID=3346978 RepID=UPI003651BD50